MGHRTICVSYAHEIYHSGLQLGHNGLVHVTLSSYMLISEDFIVLLNWVLLVMDIMLLFMPFHMTGKLWNGSLAENVVLGLTTFLEM